MAWRFLAQRAVTGEWISNDVPIQGAEPEFGLSSVGSLTGTVSPDTGRLRAPDGRLLLEPWGTFIYVEDDGVLRWGGIVIDSSFDEGVWTIECASFATYPHGIPFQGFYFEGIKVDPADMVRRLWEHVQRYPNGDLGVEVVGNTTKTVGSERQDVSITTSKGTLSEFETGPYTLAWWENIDCGKEIDSLASESQFEWFESVAWDGDDVKKTITIRDRVGGRRYGPRFVMGENIVSVPAPEMNGDFFANEVIGIGAGDGAGSLRSEAIVQDGRLRRVKVVNKKFVRVKTRLDAMTREALRHSGLLPAVTEIEIVDHPNAPIGSWGLGDTIRVEADLPWLGEFSEWHRIVGYTLFETGRAVLNLERAEAAS